MSKDNKVYSIRNKDEYLELFQHGNSDGNIQENALKTALDTRKFEIELYWKRATYFWAFIAASFAGFFALANGNQINYKYLLVTSIIGCLFSISWYLVNRGSKFWQENWERHVDFLEDKVNGPLYKTVINPEEVKFYKINQRYPISVSKINQVLSLFMIIIWAYLFIDTLKLTFSGMDIFQAVAIGTVIIVIWVFLLVHLSKSDLPKESRDIKFVTRKKR